ncbi:uncharacterized protein LOC131249652 [Magnolia sinica]|uniref:uncharacterized protein LOC131249652 n=1 Tax=Magnolia sinica TaxID=86752 RepID=UPI0026581182|nr:uncharacterized protein LOC131249652 [Magnolia sinica]
MPVNTISLACLHDLTSFDVVPHITDVVQEWIERVTVIPVDGKEGLADVCVIELGGMIAGIDFEVSSRSITQLIFFPFFFTGTGNFCLIYVSLVPVLNVVGEQKTKPTQHSVRGLRGLGLTPHILACRSATALDENVKEKLSQFCHVPAANIIILHDVSNIWHIPLLLRNQKAHEAILKVLNLLCRVTREPILEEWTSRAGLCDRLHDPVRLRHFSCQNCNGRKIYWPFRFLPLCVEGECFCHSVFPLSRALRQLLFMPYFHTQLLSIPFYCKLLSVCWLSIP